LNLCW